MHTPQAQPRTIVRITFLERAVKKLLYRWLFWISNLEAYFMGFFFSFVSPLLSATVAVGEGYRLVWGEARDLAWESSSSSSNFRRCRTTNTFSVDYTNETCGYVILVGDLEFRLEIVWLCWVLDRLSLNLINNISKWTQTNELKRLTNISTHHHILCRSKRRSMMMDKPLLSGSQSKIQKVIFAFLYI